MMAGTHCRRCSHRVAPSHTVTDLTFSQPVTVSRSHPVTQMPPSPPRVLPHSPPRCHTYFHNVTPMATHRVARPHSSPRPRRGGPLAGRGRAGRAGPGARSRAASCAHKGAATVAQEAGLRAGAAGSWSPAPRKTCWEFRGGCRHATGGFQPSQPRPFLLCQPSEPVPGPRSPVRLRKSGWDPRPPAQLVGAWGSMTGSGTCACAVPVLAGKPLRLDLRTLPGTGR